MKCDADLNCSIYSGVGQAAYKHSGLQGEGRSQSQSSQILPLLGLFGISCERRNCEVGFCHCPHLFVNKITGNIVVVLQFHHSCVVCLPPAPQVLCRFSAPPSPGQSPSCHLHLGPLRLASSNLGGSLNYLKSPGKPFSPGGPGSSLPSLRPLPSPSAAPACPHHCSAASRCLDHLTQFLPKSQLSPPRASCGPTSSLRLFPNNFCSAPFCRPSIQSSHLVAEHVAGLRPLIQPYPTQSPR